MLPEPVRVFFRNQIYFSAVDYTAISRSEYTLALTKGRKDAVERLAQFSKEYLVCEYKQKLVGCQIDAYYKALNNVFELLDAHISRLYPLVEAQMLINNGKSPEVAKHLEQAPEFSIGSSLHYTQITSTSYYAECFMCVFVMFRLAFTSFLLDYNTEMLRFALSLSSYLSNTCKKLSTAEVQAVELHPMYLQALDKLTYALGYMMTAIKASQLLDSCADVEGVTTLDVSGLFRNAHVQLEQALKSLKKAGKSDGLVEGNQLKLLKKLLIACDIGSLFYQLKSCTQDDSYQKSTYNHVVYALSEALFEFNQVNAIPDIEGWILETCSFISECAEFSGNGKKGAFKKTAPCGKIYWTEWLPGRVQSEILAPPEPVVQQYRDNLEDDASWWSLPPDLIEQ